MGCLQRAVGTGHAARLDRFKGADAVFVRALASVAPECRVDGFGLFVVWMVVFAIRICLPYLDQTIGDRAFFIENGDNQLHALALYVRAGNLLDRQRTDQADREVRSDGLRWNRREVHVISPRIRSLRGLAE